MGDPKQALTLRQALSLVLRPDISASDAAQALAPLPPPQQALAIAGAFQRAMEDATPAEADSAAEHHGRRIEAVMDELPDFQAPFKEMIEAGDTEVVLNMVKGRAGEISSAAQHLNVELIALLFEKDADMNDPGERGARLINITWTLVMETPVEHRGVNVFFLVTEEGQELARELRGMDTVHNEEVQQILRSLREREHHLPTDTEEDESK